MRYPRNSPWFRPLCKRDTFDIEVSICSEADRLLWKNVLWGETRKQMDAYFKDKPEEGSIQEFTDLMITGITEIV